MSAADGTAIEPVAAAGTTPALATRRSTCPYCGVGCGVLATPHADGSVQIAGDPEHPANFGRLCVKGSALGETLGLHGRLLHPQIGGARVGWDAALDHVAQTFQRIISEHGPEAVALYVSGQLLTEDYYVANKFVKGGLGTANIDTNSRLCMSSAVAGHKRAFGEDAVPLCYEDLEQADLIVLVGANLAWCHPILAQRIARAREQRPSMKLVVIDPRRTATCEGADLHLALAPGSDVALFDGLLAWLHAQGQIDRAFVAAHTNGFDSALAVAHEAGQVSTIAACCGLEPSQLLAFYELFAATPKVVTAFSMGVNQSSAGTDKVNAIINCHLATGRIGLPGAGPFSITGQPNAMGGREVGGLANMLAAHLELERPEHRDLVQRFWNSPRIAARPGLKAVELFQAIEAGAVRAVWIMATNPVVSLPDADQVKRALTKCELVVVSDCIAETDTTAFAHVLLPATGWSEKDGTVTNTERRISRQHAFLPPAGEARHDWQIVCDVAQRMGLEGFDFASAADVFDEHARLSAFENQGARLFDLSGLAGQSADDYDAMPPLQWPVRKGAKTGTARLFEDRRFVTADGRARFVPTTVRAPAHAPDAEFPLILNTGRVRDHWHTMTRTGRSPRLAVHVAEPFVEIHPDDAAAVGVTDGALAQLRTRWGRAVLRVRTDGGMTRGQVFAPIHWTAQFASDARVGTLVNPVVDPVSCEPEFKHTPVRVEPFAARWHGFTLSRAPRAAVAAEWWVRVTGAGFTRHELAGTGPMTDPARFAAQWRDQLPAADDEAGEWLEYEDRAAGIYRGAWIVNDRLEACLFLGPTPHLPAREWLSGLFAQARLAPADRAALLAARPAAAGVDTGPLVCSCFRVGRKTIEQAIREGCRSPQTLGAKLKCGTHCGSCVPELRSLIARVRVTA